MLRLFSDIFQHGILKTFWFRLCRVREIAIDRLEGSRRSISGHNLETNVRTSFVAAIQHYYSVYGNYGKFKKVEFADKQIKLEDIPLMFRQSYIQRMQLMKLKAYLFQLKHVKLKAEVIRIFLQETSLQQLPILKGKLIILI